MRILYGCLVSTFLSIFLWTTLTFNFSAQAELFRGPISSALGGTGVAGLPGSESALANPALVPLYGQSSVDAFYRDGMLSSGEHRQAIGLGALDHTGDSIMPGALHYLRMRDTGRYRLPVNGELWHGALGQQYNQFAIGVSGYRLIYDVPTDRSYTQWNYSVGTVYMFTTSIGIGYVLKNLANPGSEVPLGLREDLTQAFGVLMGLGDVARLRLDLARAEHFNPDHKMAYMLGFESKTNDLFIFRLGYKYDDLKFQRLWTAGLSFDGPKLKIDYAFEKNQDRTSGALHSVDLRLPF